MRRNAFLMLIGAGSLGLAGPVVSARACECPPPLESHEAFEEADAVLLGTVEQVWSEGQGVMRWLHGWPILGYTRRVAALRATTVWKGPARVSFTVATGAREGECGYAFRAGETYLVYAYQHNDGALVTDSCTRTQPASDAREDLGALGPGQSVE